MLIDISSRYEKAQAFLQEAYGAKNMVFNMVVVPYWIGDTDHFWYVRETKTDGLMNKEFRLVNAELASNKRAFDHQALAELMAKETAEDVLSNALPLTELSFDLAEETLSFKAFDVDWLYHPKQAHLQKIDQLPLNYVTSPDGKKAVFIRDYNLWVKDLETSKEKPLTQEGKAFYVYGSTVTAGGGENWPIEDVLWSPDSSRVLTTLIDSCQVRVGIPLVQHVPTDGSICPSLVRPDRRVAMYNDEHVEAWQLLSIEVDSGDIKPIAYDACPISYPLYQGYFSGDRGWWCKDSRHAYAVYQESDNTNTRVIKWDTHTGQVEILIEERSTTENGYNEIIPATHLYPLLTPLRDSNELIWYSEHSGWAHLYLYDLTTGQLKNTITQGDWLVRDILHVDACSRELVIQTGGRTQGRNPYYRDICRVNIDTGALTEVVSSDHEYVLYEKRNWFSFGQSWVPMARDMPLGVSPSGRYMVATRSRVDESPVSLLLDIKGQQQQVIEEADCSGLPTNWQWPEPFSALADDGETELCGIVFKPSHFSADKSYPILDHSYGIGGESMSSFDAGNNMHYCSAAALAELGFIVVIVHNRGEAIKGGAGLRSAAFNQSRDYSVPSHNKADSVAAIKYLAQTHSYMDINRVGAIDLMCVPTAITGMLIYPDFYKVGVSINGDSDHRLFPKAEFGDTGRYPYHEAFANNLKGKLLMIHGMLDDVEPVTMTLRMVEAFKNANKSFDLLLLPNCGHDIGAYGIRRAWDYVVEHLLNEMPPVNFELSLSDGA
ncbi:S9 family peptidase [Porticoccaceae bacterium]|nr:S9 family peptidase [Porticoccaceae bacterium]MDA9090925.1 S9 family peptidase [Porticoccaceae bacterium]